MLWHFAIDDETTVINFLDQIIGLFKSGPAYLEASHIKEGYSFDDIIMKNLRVTTMLLECKSLIKVLDEAIVWADESSAFSSTSDHLKTQSEEQK